jgi:hypothetical protein
MLTVIVAEQQGKKFGKKLGNAAIFGFVSSFIISFY